MNQNLMNLDVLSSLGISSNFMSRFLVFWNPFTASVLVLIKFLDISSHYFSSLWPPTVQQPSIVKEVKVVSVLYDTVILTSSKMADTTSKLIAILTSLDIRVLVSSDKLSGDLVTLSSLNIKIFSF